VSLRARRAPFCAQRSRPSARALIVNANQGPALTNLLMDVPEKHPGYTHVALGVESIEETVAELGRLGITITGGPTKLGDRRSLFARDPDRNVIELREIEPVHAR